MSRTHSLSSWIGQGEINMDKKLLYTVSYFLAIIIGIISGVIFNLMTVVFNVSDYWAFAVIPISGFLSNIMGNIFRKLMY
jgi:hypothetical protein